MKPDWIIELVKLPEYVVHGKTIVNGEIIGVPESFMIFNRLTTKTAVTWRTMQQRFFYEGGTLAKMSKTLDILKLI